MSTISLKDVVAFADKRHCRQIFVATISDETLATYGDAAVSCNLFWLTNKKNDSLLFRVILYFDGADAPVFLGVVDGPLAHRLLDDLGLVKEGDVLSTECSVA